MLLEVTIDGANVVGPVTLDQLRRGVHAGRVPSTAHARPAGTHAWSPITHYLGSISGQHAGHAAPPQAQPGGWYAAPPAQQPWSPPAHGQYPPPSTTQPAAYPPAPQPAHYPQAPAYTPAPQPSPATAPASTETAISEAEQRLAALRRELESVEEALEIQSFGFYKVRYGFESSREYTERLKDVREQQKLAIKKGTATACDANWTVDGSAAEGRKMVAQQSKLMLRAFNGECDAAIAKVRYDNVVVLEDRLRKSHTEINKLGESKKISITDQYFELKLSELRLVHEHREKVHEEKEEQKRIKEQMREEQKAREEIERAQEEAEQEEARSQKALEKARADLDASTGKQHEKLEALVNKLETELQSALDRKAKAIARAQLTRSGHVYILSNLGSFGDGIYKIGLTRRLDPYERVDELGDASVPFPFDVHAIIFAEDAPGLENRLHQRFADRRVNLVNMRKEYFRVTLDEIRDAVEKEHGLVSFVLTAEAEEYRKTVAKLSTEGPPRA
ncbi:MAG: DUF4041 domain-containing protein [Myxococcales bacterium]|nr:DUF4041 domain-containing protein [Myxococcales bacterium]